MTPLVSVVVISYNDAARLRRAIASLQRQSLRSIEIIVVDDASTDDTENVVARLAAQDPRIRYERLPENSGGCSAPRNRGMSLARADWVMFCDSDDEYELHACANLLRAVEEAEADIACGTAERIDVRTGEAQRWRPELHDQHRVVDRLTDLTDLLYDTISVNKIYRRSLLERHGLQFPEGLLFEDQLFTLQVMAFAQRIAVIPETVYRWYVEKVSETPSITQRRQEMRNVEDRIEINRRIDAFLAVQGSQRLTRAKEVKFLKHDLWLYLSSMLECDDATAEAIADVLAPYVGQLDLARCWEIAPMLRVAVYHLLVGDVSGVRAAMRFIRWSSSVSRTVQVRDDREFWGCSHLANGPEVAGRSAAEWLDVTDIGIARIPFSQRRYLHLLESVDLLDDGTVALHGSSVDYDGLLVGADAVELQWAVRGGRVAAHLVVVWDAAGRWTARGSLTAGPIGALRPEDSGAVQMSVRRGDLVNISPLRSAAPVDVLIPAAPPAQGRMALGRGDAAAVIWAAVDVAALPVHATGLREAARQRTAVALGHRRLSRTTVLLEADDGRGFGGDVGRVAAALRGLSDEWDFVWSMRSSVRTVPEGTRIIERGSREHGASVARAGIVVTDGIVPAAVGDRALVVRVGMGSPVHRMGLDDPSVLTDRAAMRALRRDAKRWSILVAPTAASGALLAEAHGFHGRVLVAGLPSVDDPMSRAAARDMLDLPSFRPVVVYLPARRGDRRPLLDVEQWSSRLGAHTYLVVIQRRGEEIEVPTRLRAFVRSVSDRDLLTPLLAAGDLVVSDYSSEIGAVAALDRDLVLFQPDRRRFVDREHGLYPGIGAVGPVVEDSALLYGTVEDWLAQPADLSATWAIERRAWAHEWAGVSGSDAAVRIAAVIAETVS